MNLKTEILKTVLATKQAIKLKRHSIVLFWNKRILKSICIRIIRIFFLFNCYIKWSGMETKNDLYCLDDNQIVIYMEQLSLCKFNLI